MSAATWDDLGPEARVLRDVMRSRAFGAVSGEAGLQETQGTCHVADAAARRLAARREAAAPAAAAAPARGDDVRPASPTVWKSTSAPGAPGNSSLSHFSAMTLPCWLRRAARNRHRHAIEQASRRWRGGRRDD